VTLLSLAVSAVALGFIHGLGADHLMAIAALATDGRAQRARIIQTAVGFAVGHMVVLGLGATAAIAFGLVLPAAFETGAERLGGFLLILLGTLGLWGVVSGRAYSHLHPEDDGRTRWHFHFGVGHHPHAHSPLPTALGAVFALSSLRAIMLLEPFGASASMLALPTLLLLNILFGIGILMSMSLFGVLLARVLSLGAVEIISRVGALVVAVASVLLGAYWIWMS
jgi:hypothetical protein